MRCDEEGNLVMKGEGTIVWQREWNETSFGVEACKMEEGEKG